MPLEGVFQLTLMRGFSKVDEEGRITIPNNIRREVELKAGQLVEVKVAGAGQAQYVVIHKRKQVR